MRAAWTGFSNALRLQGIEIDEIDVFSWGCGLTLPTRSRRMSHLDEFAPFAPWNSSLTGKDGLLWRDRLPFTLPSASNDPLLLRAIDLVHRFARMDGTSAPWLALPLILQGLGVTQSVLPCLVAGAKALRLRTNPSFEIIRAIIRSITSASVAGLQRLDHMQADHRRAVRAVAGEYRPGALMPLAALIAARPLLSPQSTARALDLSIGGAGKLLARAADLDLLVEVSGRQTWRLYLAPDLARSFGFIPTPRGRPTKEPPALPFDRSLSEALAAFDREMAAIDRQLGATTAIDDETNEQ